MDTQLFEVPAVAMPILEEKLGKLALKAIKFGSGNIRLRRVGRKTDASGKQIVIVALEGDEVRILGYKFVGRLDHNVDPTGASNIVYTMPGEELTPAQRSAPARCEHCGYQRKRKDTYFFREDHHDTMIQVGRTCLGDFMGHDPKKLLLRAQFITKIIDTVRDAGQGGKAYLTDRRWVDLETYLSYVVDAIETNGWTSGKEAFNDPNKMSTRHQAANAMFRWPAPAPEEAPTADQIETAGKVIEYVKTLDPTQSDFQFNLVQMSKLQTIDWKATGMAAAMVYAYNKAQAPATTTAPKKDYSGSVYVGDLGDRLERKVTILSSTPKEGQFGSYNVTRMLGEDGNVYVSFGKFYADQDHTLTVRGTVVDHHEFNNAKQTKLNRVAAVFPK